MHSRTFNFLLAAAAAVLALSATPSPTAAESQTDAPQVRNLTAEQTEFTRIRISWDAPTGFSRIRGYIVEVRDDANTTPPYTKFLKSPDELVTRVAGMRPTATYTVKVRALGSVLGPFASVKITMHDGSVQNLTATPVSDSAIKVTWGPPPNFGSVRRYDVTMIGPSEEKYRGVLNTITETTFENLTRGETYTFWVKAASYGLNGRSKTVQATLPRLAPGSAENRGASAGDEVMNETLRFKRSKLKVVEGERGEMRITRSGDLMPAIQVTVTFADGSASSPGDYKSARRVVSFPDGKRFRDVRLPIVDYKVDEDDETFTVSLASDAEGYTLGGPATVTIKDDDTAGVELSTTTISVKESWKDTYGIKLTSKPTAVVTVTAASDDTKKLTVGGAASSTLVFTPRNWNKAQTVKIYAAASEDSAGVRHTAASDDPKYDDIAIPTVGVTIAALETPGAVTDLRTTLGEDNSVKVTWEAPAGDVKGYIVWLEPQGGAKGRIEGRIKRPKADKRSLTFRNLEPGVTYRVHVRAQNKPGMEGKGERAASAEFTVPRIPPSE